VELATGFVFVLAFYFAHSNIIFLFYVLSVLVIIFVYDLKHYEIPDKILLPAIVITFLYSIIFSWHLMPNFLSAGAISAGFFFTVFLISKGKWMGFGDVKLALLMGLLLGLPNVLTALFLAFFLGAIIGIILMIFHKKGLKSEISFGPFLVLGTITSLFYGQVIIQWYLNFLQI